MNELELGQIVYVFDGERIQAAKVSTITKCLDGESSATAILSVRRANTSVILNDYRIWARSVDELLDGLRNNVFEWMENKDK